MHPEDDHTPPRPAPVPPPPGPHPAATPAGRRKRRGPRPVPPGREYHRVLSTEKRQIWRGIAALALLMGGMLVFSFGFAILGMVVDLLIGRDSLMTGGDEYTPVLHGATLLGLALLLPWSMLIQRWLYGVRGASLHSVLSLFRMEVFGRALLVILPLWTLYMAVFTVVGPSVPEADWAFRDIVAIFALTLLLAPLQSAGEEYGFRGLAFRVAASWGRGPRTALALGVVVSSLLFTSAHLALDPWLNLYYFTMGVALSLITWRTGGLEIAVVIHAVNNTVAFLLSVVLRSDFAEGFDRSTGAGSAAMLVPCVLLVAITAVVWFRTRRTGPELTPTEHPRVTAGPADTSGTAGDGESGRAEENGPWGP
ncbi:CPBP family intramembrane glutamic endopeptidase [Nocardiopsis sp. B62]|uniref:CPBP family intramembrane glutamic endopeptidase n=1 Tax=Nocardiopsis sp. B62 TaxID=2824874 RepID=UPI001B39AC04|nr:CPBP family intramembrane glutamic endopeptidase [Nocardiopsis sp. B62]MBQ1083471.1 CPBP family intramembrane metalloprotease [Nocardiopsis sp. B62]